MNKNEDRDLEKTSRRTFLQRLTGTVLGLGAAVGSWPVFRSLVPNVLYEPPKRIRIGLPGSFQSGLTFLEEHRVFLLREGNSYSAISGVCSHLGCTVKFAPFEQAQQLVVRDYDFQSLGEFHCPCHGSKFHGDGTNYSGPAPRPLQWHNLEVSPKDGSLVVDLAIDVDRDFKLVV
jgi:menaquinol-cytochrome c reductase iron-sulfur subunit